MKDKKFCDLREKSFIQHLQLWANKYFHSCFLNYYQNIVSFYKQQKTSIQYLQMFFSDKDVKSLKVHPNFYFLNKGTIILG